MPATRTFQHLGYRLDEAKAAELAIDEAAPAIPLQPAPRLRQAPATKGWQRGRWRRRGRRVLGPVPPFAAVGT